MYCILSGVIHLCTPDLNTISIPFSSLSNANSTILSVFFFFFFKTRTHRDRESFYREASDSWTFRRNCFAFRLKRRDHGCKINPRHNRDSWLDCIDRIRFDSIRCSFWQAPKGETRRNAIQNRLNLRQDFFSSSLPHVRAWFFLKLASDISR